MDETLKCLHCEKEQTAEEILKTCQHSFPHLEALGFTCPSCKKNGMVRISGGIFQSIEVISLPGPEWVSHDSMRPGQFEYRIESGCIHCWLNGIHYEFKAK